MGNQHVSLTINDDGLVTSVGNQQSNEIFETCVICGKLTDILINSHIDYRYGYVEGCGQCCRECYDNTNNSHKDYVADVMRKRTTHITISLETILDTPNDYELGEKVRKMAWNLYNDLNPNKNKNIWVCSICGKDTSDVEYDYLVGTNHLSCELEKKSQ